MNKKRELSLDFTFSREPTRQSPESWTNSDVEPDSSKGRWSTKLEAKFTDAFSKHLQKKKKAYGKANNNKHLYRKKSADARDLNRLAWVLEKLNPKRVCVAVLVAKGGLHIYANVIDRNGIRRHMRALVDARKNAAKRTELSDVIASSLQKERRGRTAGKTLRKTEKKARRRLKKALRMLQFLMDDNKDTLTKHVHRPKVSDKHAEMRAADAAIPGSRGFIGISKLCCGKCYLGLRAARKMGLKLHVQGAHFKTYDSSPGWPVPSFLVENQDAMKAFLGKKAYAIYKKFPVQCLALIKTKKFKAEAFASTDMVSSEEEVGSDE